MLVYLKCKKYRKHDINIRLLKSPAKFSLIADFFIVNGEMKRLRG